MTLTKWRCGRLFHRHGSAMKGVAVKAPYTEEPIMPATTIIGLDMAKSVFQVHGIDAAAQVVVRRQLKRRYVLAKPFD